MFCSQDFESNNTTVIKEGSPLSTPSSENSLFNNADLSPDFHCRHGNKRHHRQLRTSKLLRRELRAATSLSVVVGLFALCWLPLNIHNTLLFFGVNSPTPGVWTDLFILLSHANSLMNPFVYAFRMREWKRAFQTLLGRIKSWKLLTLN